MIPLCFSPRLDAEGQVELYNNASQPLVMPFAGCRLRKVGNAGGEFAVKGVNIHGHGVLCPLNRLLKAIYLPVLYYPFHLSLSLHRPLEAEVLAPNLAHLAVSSMENDALNVVSAKIFADSFKIPWAILNPYPAVPL